jgi:hypothetical protein
MAKILLIMCCKHMQVEYYFVHLVAKKRTVKTEFKMYCKYKHMQI